MYHGTMLGGGMWIGWIFWFILIGIAMYFTVKNLNKVKIQNEQEEDTAIDIASRRYASGEIDKPEYLKIKKELEK